MVDVNVGGSDDGGEDDKSKKSKAKKKKKKKKKRSSGKTETFELGDEEKMDGSETEVSDMSKSISEQAELNYESKGKESLNTYAKRQVKECEELYDSMLELVKDAENYEEFAVYMHAVYMNFGNNRAGIAKTIMDNFDKSKSEALTHTNKICKKAGEKECFEKMVNFITKEFCEGL